MEQAPTPARPARDEESLRHEYGEVALMYRHYSNLRFVLFGLFLGLTGALAKVALNLGDTYSASACRIAGLTGVLTSLLFLFFELKTYRYIDHYEQRAVALEVQLGYAAFSGRPEPAVFRMRHATSAFFAVMLLCWAAQLLGR